MPQLDWEPLEFLELLGVAPKEEEFGTLYEYTLERGQFRLELKVWPLDSDIELKFYCAGQSEPVLNLNLLGCPGARVVDDKRGRFIEFAGANMFVGRFDRTAPAPYGFRLQVDPFIQVTPYSYNA